MKTTGRWMPDSAITTYFGKPVFHAYGNGNTDPIVGGTLYGDYMKTHNVNPHSGANQPEFKQVYSRAIIGAATNNAIKVKVTGKTKSPTIKKEVHTIHPVLPRTLLQQERQEIASGAQTKEALVKRNPIMPERFSDEQDENHHIQHVNINRPDFHLHDNAIVKSMTTHDDFEQDNSHKKLPPKSTGTKSALRDLGKREPTSPADSKLNAPIQAKKQTVDFKPPSIDGFRTNQEQMKEQVLAMVPQKPSPAKQSPSKPPLIAPMSSNGTNTRVPSHTQSV